MHLRLCFQNKSGLGLGLGLEFDCVHVAGRKKKRIAHSMCGNIRVERVVPLGKNYAAWSCEILLKNELIYFHFADGISRHLQLGVVLPSLVTRETRDPEGGRLPPAAHSSASSAT